MLAIHTGEKPYRYHTKKIHTVLLVFELIKMDSHRQEEEMIDDLLSHE